MSKKIRGGSPYGEGDAIIDARGAVLLDEVHVAVIDAVSGDATERRYTVALGGRVNKTQRRADQLYIMGPEGIATLVSELVALGARAGAENLVGYVRAALDEIDRVQGPGRMTGSTAARHPRS